MLPYQTLIEITRDSPKPVYLQISNQLIMLIKRGVLASGLKIPGTRQMAKILNTHRQTIVRAYEELYNQGWLEQIASRGTFVSRQLPEIKAKKIQDTDSQLFTYPKETGYNFTINPQIARPVLKANTSLGFDDGFPDVRLAPWEALARQYRNIVQRSFQKHLFSYSDTLGNQFLREKLLEYLRQSRGLPIRLENILITRGCIMGIYQVAQMLINQGDKVAVTEWGYMSAELSFKFAGAELVRVPFDENGIIVDELAKICQKKTIRLLYLTPHHHYPTTVTLSAERRIQLLQLAESQGFIILEDDYDYDYHYSGSSILPLASADAKGMVIYVGSLSKLLAPAIRVGYVVAPENLIAQLAYFRRIIDRQGDNILEQTVAELMAEGEIKRHTRKAQKVYEQRRNLFVQLAKSELSEWLDFKIPNGGMAIWGEFKPQVNLQNLAQQAQNQGFYIGNGLNYADSPLNATRMGFASLNEEEMKQSIDVLKNLLKKESN